MTVQSSPGFTGVIEQRPFVEPLRGPHDVNYFIDLRFPEEIYRRGVETHLYRYLSLMLGDAGAKWLRKNYLQARALLEALGIDMFDLDKFYGNPFKFGRILQETFEEDASGLIPKDVYERILAKNIKYRNRALDFVNGARAGGTPFGMRLVARSGLGHDVEIIENYKYLFDQHSDRRLGLRYFGSTYTTEEMIVLPRRELSKSETQRLEFVVQGVNAEDQIIEDGPFGYAKFQINFRGVLTKPILYNATARGYEPILADPLRPGWDAHKEGYTGVQQALEALASDQGQPIIGVGNVKVTGGPLPYESVDITFTGKLSGVDIPRLEVDASGLYTPSHAPILALVTTLVGGVEARDEIVDISDSDLHSLQTAIDRTRPVTSIPTTYRSSGLQTRNNFVDSYASSEYSEVIRYVTGNREIAWPPTQNDPVHWVEAGIEHEAPKIYKDLQYHYKNFHNIYKVRAYDDTALARSDYASNVDGIVSNSTFYGQFSPQQIRAFPFLSGYVSTSHGFAPEDALAAYPEPPVIGSAVEIKTKLVAFYNGIYPTDYPFPPLLSDENKMWASQENSTGSEYLEIDLGNAQAINYLSFEILRLPVTITVTYDVWDALPARRFIDIAPIRPYGNIVSFNANAQNPWSNVELMFTDRRKDIIFARNIRIQFKRRDTDFLTDLSTGIQYPWSVAVRNLRIGRNIS